MVLDSRDLPEACRTARGILPTAAHSHSAMDMASAALPSIPSKVGHRNDMVVAEVLRREIVHCNNFPGFQNYVALPTRAFREDSRDTHGICVLVHCFLALEETRFRSRVHSPSWRSEGAIVRGSPHGARLSYSQEK